MKDECKPEEPVDEVEDLDVPPEEGDNVKGGIQDGTSNTLTASCSTGKHFPGATITP